MSDQLTDLIAQIYIALPINWTGTYSLATLSKNNYKGNNLHLKSGHFQSLDLAADW